MFFGVTEMYKEIIVTSVKQNAVLANRKKDIYCVGSKCPVTQPSISGYYMQYGRLSLESTSFISLPRLFFCFKTCSSPNI